MFNFIVKQCIREIFVSASYVFKLSDYNVFIKQAGCNRAEQLCNLSEKCGGNNMWMSNDIISRITRIKLMLITSNASFNNTWSTKKHPLWVIA